MNHIIQMLEDQQDEKTGSVTEELILYCFLGVFVIFVVDSFVVAIQQWFQRLLAFEFDKPALLTH